MAPPARLAQALLLALLAACRTLPATPDAAAAPAPLAARPFADEIVYFVLVDRFADGDPGNDAGADRTAPGTFHGGDLAGLLGQLDEIASLGVTMLWLNPLVKNVDGPVTGAGFPDWGYHGYWADDLSRLDPRFGTEEQLRRLVEACHARGIKVILDVVYNHAGYGSRYLADPRTRDWLRAPDRGDCGADDLTSCLSGLPDWKTERPEVQEWLLGQHLPLARRVGLDGFRLDTVKHVEHAFWGRHRRLSREVMGPGFFLLGEVWGGDAVVLDPWFEPDELDAGFDFGFQGSALGWVKGRGRTVAFDRYLASRHKVRPGHHLAHYLSSHDVPGGLFQLGGDARAFRLAAALQLGVAGIPVLYYGEEVGRPGGAWPQNRSDFPWGGRAVLPGAGLPRDEALRAWYVRAVAARRAHPALARGAHRPLATEGELYLFLRHDPASGDAVVVAVNRGEGTATARAAWPDGVARPAPEDLLGGGAVAAFEGSSLVVTLPGRTAAYLAPPPAGPAR